MSNKDEFAKLFVKTKRYTVGKNLPKEQQAQIDITPLSMDEIDLFAKKPGASKEEDRNRMKELISKATGVPVEDVSKLSIEFLEEVLDDVMDACGVKDEEFLRKMKEAAQQKALNDIEQ